MPDYTLSTILNNPGIANDKTVRDREVANYAMYMGSLQKYGDPATLVKNTERIYSIAKDDSIAPEHRDLMIGDIVGGRDPESENSDTRRAMSDKKGGFMDNIGRSWNRALGSVAEQGAAVPGIVGIAAFKDLEASARRFAQSQRVANKPLLSQKQIADLENISIDDFADPAFFGTEVGESFFQMIPIMAAGTAVQATGKVPLPVTGALMGSLSGLQVAAESYNKMRDEGYSRDEAGMVARRVLAATGPVGAALGAASGPLAGAGVRMAGRALQPAIAGGITRLASSAAVRSGVGAATAVGAAATVEGSQELYETAIQRAAEEWMRTQAGEGAPEGGWIYPGEYLSAANPLKVFTGTAEEKKTFIMGAMMGLIMDAPPAVISQTENVLTSWEAGGISDSDALNYAVNTRRQLKAMSAEQLQGEATAAGILETPENARQAVLQKKVERFTEVKGLAKLAKSTAEVTPEMAADIERFKAGNGGIEFEVVQPDKKLESDAAITQKLFGKPTLFVRNPEGKPIARRGMMGDKYNIVDVTAGEQALFDSRSVTETIVHEAIHVLQQQSPQAWEQLASVAMEDADLVARHLENENKNRRATGQAEITVNDLMAKEELVSDFIAQYGFDADFLKRIEAKNPAVMQELEDSMGGWFQQLRKKLNVLSVTNDRKRITPAKAKVEAILAAFEMPTEAAKPAAQAEAQQQAKAATPVEQPAPVAKPEAAAPSATTTVSEPAAKTAVKKDLTTALALRKKLNDAYARGESGSSELVAYNAYVDDDIRNKIAEMEDKQERTRIAAEIKTDRALVASAGMVKKSMDAALNSGKKVDLKKYDEITSKINSAQERISRNEARMLSLVQARNQAPAATPETITPPDETIFTEFQERRATREAMRTGRQQANAAFVEKAKQAQATADEQADIRRQGMEAEEAELYFTKELRATEAQQDAEALRVRQERFAAVQEAQREIEEINAAGGMKPFVRGKLKAEIKKQRGELANAAMSLAGNKKRIDGLLAESKAGAPPTSKELGMAMDRRKQIISRLVRATAKIAETQKALADLDAPPAPVPQAPASPAPAAPPADLPSVGTVTGPSETAAPASDTLESMAVAVGNSQNKLLAKLKEAKSVLDDDVRKMFGTGTFDFANKRIVSDDGKIALQWKLRDRPDLPSSYENQQTSRGVVVLTEVAPSPAVPPEPSPAKAEKAKPARKKKGQADAAAVMERELGEIQAREVGRLLAQEMRDEAKAESAQEERKRKRASFVEQNATTANERTFVADMVRGDWEKALGDVDAGRVPRGRADELAGIAEGQGLIDAVQRKRFEIASDEKFSTARVDADYLAAVKRGDMAEAQRMVDAAANRAMPNSKVRNPDGTLKKVYHGGRSGLTKFSAERKSAYLKDSLHSQGIWLTVNPGDMLGDNTAYEAAAYAQNFRDGKVYGFYANIENPAKISDTGIAQRGITADTVRAGGNDGAWMTETGFWVALDSSQVKSADPVTYDDAGNVIPLSERFKPEQDDIRFSTARVSPQARLGEQIFQREGEPKPTRGLGVASDTEEGQRMIRATQEAEEALGSIPRTTVEAQNRRLDAWLAENNMTRVSVGQYMAANEDYVKIPGDQVLENLLAKEAMFALQDTLKLSKEADRLKLASAQIAYRKSGTPAGTALAMRVIGANRSNRQQIEEALFGTEKDRKTQKEQAAAIEALKNEGIDIDTIDYRNGDTARRALQIIEEEYVSFNPFRRKNFWNEFRLAAIQDSAQSFIANATGFSYGAWRNAVIAPFANAIMKDGGFGLNAEAMEEAKMVAELAASPEVMREAWNLARLSYASGTDMTSIKLGTQTGENMTRNSQLYGGLKKIAGLLPWVDPAKAKKGAKLTGRVVSAGQELSMATDAAMRFQAYKSVVGWVALNKGKKNGLSGEALREFVRNELANPTNETHAEAVEAANTYAFQNRKMLDESVLGFVSKGIETLKRQDMIEDGKLKSIVGLAARQTFPFVSTPLLLRLIGLKEFTPLALIPAAGGVKAMLNKTATRADAEAVVQGVMMSAAWGLLGMLMYDDKDKKRITGGGMANQFLPKARFEAETMKPMTIRLGDSQYSYARFDPYASPFAMTVDFFDAIRRVSNGEEYQQAWQNFAPRLIGQANEAVMLKGVTDLKRLLDASAKGEPGAFGEYGISQAASFMPAFTRHIPQAADASIRETSPSLDAKGSRAIQRLLPAIASTPLPKRDWLGRPRSKPNSTIPLTTFGFRLLAPVQAEKIPENVLNNAIIRWNETHAGVDNEYYPTYFKKSMTIEGKTVNLTDAEYDAMLAERGQLIMKNFASSNKLWRINSNNPTQRDMDRISNLVDKAHGDVMKKYRKIVEKRVKSRNSLK